MHTNLQKQLSNYLTHDEVERCADQLAPITPHVIQPKSYNRIGQLVNTLPSQIHFTV